MEANENNLEKILNEIIIAMKDLLKNFEDTTYIKDNETVFERLSSIYLNNGGKYEILEKEFPDCF